METSQTIYFIKIDQDKIKKFKIWINKVTTNQFNYSENEYMLLIDYLSFSQSSMINILFLLRKKDNDSITKSVYKYFCPNSTIRKLLLLIIAFHYYNNNKNLFFYAKLEKNYIPFFKLLYDDKMLNENDTLEFVLLCFKLAIYSETQPNNLRQIGLFSFGINLLNSIFKISKNLELKQQMIETCIQYLQTKIFSNYNNEAIMNKRNDMLKLLKIEDSCEFKVIDNNNNNDNSIQELIMNLLKSIYSFSYSEIVFNYFVKNTKKAFININKLNSTLIKSNISLLNRQLNLITNIIKKESNQLVNNELFSGFIFNDSQESGIIITNTELSLNNNVILFSFNQHHQSKDNKATLFSIYSSDLLPKLSLYILNSKLYFESKKGAVDTKLSIELNTVCYIQLTLLTALSIFSNSSIKIRINNYSSDLLKVPFSKEKGDSIVLGCSIKGSVNDSLKTNNFIGIIGPFLFYDSLFIPSEAKILSDNYWLYDQIAIDSNAEKKYLLTYHLNNNNDLFHSFTNSKPQCKLFIHPFIVLNSFESKKKYTDNYRWGSGDKEIYWNASTYNFSVNPIPENHGTYPINKIETIKLFLEYDGIDLIILNIEYHYTLMRKLIDSNAVVSDIIPNTYQALEAIFELNYLITEFKCKNECKKLLEEQMRLYFSFAKVISLLSTYQKPPNNLLMKIEKIIEIKCMPLGLKKYIFHFLMDPFLFDYSINKAAFIYLFKQMILMIQDLTRNSQNISTSFIQKMFDFKFLLKNSFNDEITNEYKYMINVLVQSSKLRHILLMLSLLSNYNDSLIETESILELIYCNYVPKDVITEEEKQMIVDKCLELKSYVKKANIQSTDMIDALLLRIIFELGSITLFNNNLNADFESPALLSREETNSSTKGNSFKNEKYFLDYFSYTISVMKSLFATFYDSTSSYQKLKQIKNDSLQIELVNVKLFFLKPFTLETKCYLMILVTYIRNIPIDQQDLFQFGSKLLITILKQLLKLRLTLAKESTIKCCFNHIFESNKICYMLFDTCYKRLALDDDNFLKEISQDLKTITEAIIYCHSKPFIYSLYSQLIKNSSLNHCEYLDHFNFKIDLTQASAYDIKCYENNIKEYAIMIRKLIDEKDLPLNFKTETNKFIQVIIENKMIYSPTLYQYTKEAQKMTILEMVIEVLDKLFNDDFKFISYLFWETKEKVNTVMYCFDNSNLNKQSSLHSYSSKKDNKKQKESDKETNCLCWIIYNKYKENEKWKKEKEILTKLEQEIEELNHIKNIKNKKNKKKQKYIENIHNTNMESNKIFIEKSKEESSSLSHEYDLLDNKLNNSFSQCENETCHVTNANANNSNMSSSKKKQERSLSGSNSSLNKLLPIQEEKQGKYQGFYDILIPEAVICCKRDLILKQFALHFLDIYFSDDQFNKIKAAFVADVIKDNHSPNTIYSHSDMLNFPSKIRNYSSCSSFQPRIFLKKDMKFYKSMQLKISHDYYQPNPVENDIQTFNTLISDKDSSKPLNSKYFDLTNRLFESRAELIKINYITQGTIYLLEKCILFYSCKNDKSHEQYENDINYCYGNNPHEIIQTDKETILILDQIEEMLIRRFLYMYQAIEVFMKNGKSYLFNLFQSEWVLRSNESNDKGIFNHLKELKLKYSFTFKITDDPRKEVATSNITDKWIKNDISTYEFLLLLNKYGGRSYNDMSQYPIMPWVFLFSKESYENKSMKRKQMKEREQIANQTSKTNQTSKIELSESGIIKSKAITKTEPKQQQESVNKEKNKEPEYITQLFAVRDFQYPISIQKQDDRDKIYKKYETQKKEGIKFPIHFHLFYSTSGYVMYFLFRLNPFSNAQIEFQSNKFDSPSRQFHSFQCLSKIMSANFDNRELLPELFSSFEFYYNLNYNNFGMRPSERVIVHHLEMPENILNAAQLVFLNHKVINTIFIKERIHQWIDSIFGYYQLQLTSNKMNIFNKFCYSKKMNLNEKKAKYIKANMSNNKIVSKIKGNADCVLSFGQIPEQLFTNKITPWTPIENESYRIDNNEEVANFMDNYNVICKDSIHNKDDPILLINLTSNKKYVYVLMKGMKFQKIWHIKKYQNKADISDPLNINIAKMKLFKIRYGDKFLLRYQPKYSVFDTHDGTYFFTCRHYDNSIRIYTKDSEAIYLTNSFVMSLCSINDDEFLSGSKNGKLIHWAITYSTNNKEKNVQINKKRELFAHNTLISSINYIQKHNIIITTGDDHLLLIRKYYTFELLTKIKNNNNNDYFTDCIYSSFNFIYTMTLDVKKGKNDNKCFYITGYSLNGISFSKTKYERFNGLSIDNNGMLIAGIYDPPSIALWSLERIKNKCFNSNNDIQIIPEIIPFKENFPWPSIDNIKKGTLFSNFLYLNYKNTFYVVLSNIIGRFICNENQPKTRNFFYNKYSL